ncbi:hypothetical protein PMAC_001809 [Pneumocystis sp. 'macacae']|nr:hypothetical protein PMAC_001809 [Pneumocystis sp. 'macacae']
MSVENNAEKSQNVLTSTENNREKSKRSRTKYIIIAAAFVVFLLVVLTIVIFVVRAHGKKARRLDDSRRVTFDKWYFGDFKPFYQSIDWVYDNEGVSYFDRGNGGIRRVYLNGTNYEFLNRSQIKKSNGGGFIFYTYSVSYDMKYVLFLAYMDQKWRHSSLGNYWVYDVEKQKLIPLIKEDSSAKVSYARWSPTGHHLAYVYKNDLYIQKGTEDAKQITKDGSYDVFNGIPDWVYEEEVFSSDHVLWWSPDSKYLTFLRIDDTNISDFDISLYMDIYSTKYTVPIYPESFSIKYPRVGSKNPEVSLHIVDITNGYKVTHLNHTDTKHDDSIILEVAWVGKTEFLVKKVNRVSDFLYVYLFNATNTEGKLIRTLNATKIDGGWFEPGMHIVPVPSNREVKRYGNGYLEIAINQGYYHIAYYRLSSHKNPRFLTSGDWEVVKICGFDSFRSTVYFIATKKSSIERHLYKVSLSGGNITAITNDNEDGYYEANFSPSGTAYLLTYRGPGVPWQKIKKVDNSDYDLIIEENEDLAERLKEHTLPKKKYYTLNVNGYDMNAVEILPPNFDGSGAIKYPVLFHVYGAPTSQRVSKEFNVPWHSVLSSEPDLQSIVVIVDGRGTGFMGRKFLVEVREKLGVYDALDQLEVAKIWKTKKYVDKRKFAIWGWSYGGYVTLKVLEKGTGLFQYGIAVAPATDFRYYDTIYTERYLNTYDKNLAGYQDASVRNILGFKNVTRFLIMHGSADENVHVQHTMNFIGNLVYNGLTNYDMHIFPDNAHGISANNARYSIYKRMTEWLKEAFRN